MSRSITAQVPASLIWAFVERWTGAFREAGGTADDFKNLLADQDGAARRTLRWSARTALHRVRSLQRRSPLQVDFSDCVFTVPGWGRGENMKLRQLFLRFKGECICSDELGREQIKVSPIAVRLLVVKSMHAPESEQVRSSVLASLLLTHANTMGERPIEDIGIFSSFVAEFSWLLQFFPLSMPHEKYAIRALENRNGLRKLEITPHEDVQDLCPTTPFHVILVHAGAH